MYNNIGSFIKGVQRAPRRFSYNPRFHNPEREDFERRKLRIEREVARERGEAVDSTPTGISFKGANRQAGLTRARRQSNKRVMSIVLLMGLLVGLVWGLDFLLSALDNDGVRFLDKLLK